MGGILETSILLNSEGESVNAVEASLRFPPERLQLVTPTAGNSIISLWTSQPTVNNEKGTLHLQGVILGGTNISRGLVATLRFRVKAPGEAFLQFNGEKTRVLRNDGNGTDALHNTQNAVFSLKLPPPLGPVVASPTHPDETRWYPTKTALFKWTSILSDVTGFSYLLNDNPVDIPDNISEGTAQSVSYSNLPDGTHYFHIKSLQSSSWGGTTNFAVNVDTSSPAEFPLRILPAARTNSHTPVFEFLTTDNLSGLDHYELKIIPLSPETAFDQPIFVEATSPFVAPELALGDYDVLVRAYDKAGNYRDVKERVSIVLPLFRYFDSSGVHAFGEYLPWLLFITLLVVLVLLLSLVVYGVKRWRYAHQDKRTQRIFPEETQAQIEELKKYREKYGKLAVVAFCVLFSFTVPFSGRAQEASNVLPPPIMDTFSSNISNQDIFYVGGKVVVSHAEVVLYLQNLYTGEVFTENIIPKDDGEWFYRHNTFLPPGDYMLWAQTKLGESASPPSPQNRIKVTETALQIGSTRLSYEFLYLVLTLLLSLAVVALTARAIHHGYRGRKERKLWLAETRQAEESVRRGFAVLRRDVEAEIALVKKAKLSREISQEEELREGELLRDLQIIEERIGKEILDIEHLVQGSQG